MPALLTDFVPSVASKPFSSCIHPSYLTGSRNPTTSAVFSRFGHTRGLAVWVRPTTGKTWAREIVHGKAGELSRAPACVAGRGSGVADSERPGAKRSGATPETDRLSVGRPACPARREFWIPYRRPYSQQRNALFALLTRASNSSRGPPKPQGGHVERTKRDDFRRKDLPPLREGLVTETEWAGDPLALTDERSPSAYARV